jgi:hypothetical protein
MSDFPSENPFQQFFDEMDEAEAEIYFGENGGESSVFYFLLRCDRSAGMRFHAVGNFDGDISTFFHYNHRK